MICSGDISKVYPILSIPLIEFDIVQNVCMGIGIVGLEIVVEVENFSGIEEQIYPFIDL